MMTKATKNPAPERAANTGLTWVLGALVRNGSVDGGSGRWLPMGAMVVDVGEVVAVIGGAVAGKLGGTCCLGAGTKTGGGGTVGATVTGSVVAGLDVEGAVSGVVWVVRGECVVVRLSRAVVALWRDTTVAARTGLGPGCNAGATGRTTAATRIVPAAELTARLSAVTSQRGIPSV